MPAWKKMVLHGSSGSLAHLKLENLTSQNVLGTDAQGNVVAGSVSGYTLPTATSSTLGGIKVGGTLTISNGVLSARTYVGATPAVVGLEGGDGTDGVAGYVPAATSVQSNLFLRGDGTWQTPTNTVTRLRQSGGTLVAGDFTFAGSGATTVSYSNGTFTISSTDTNTTYSVGDGGLTEKNFTTALKTKLDGIASSADNYSSWTISDSTRSEAIRSGDTLTIRGAGATTVLYDAATNIMTVSSTDTDTNTTYSAGTGLTLSGTTFSVTANTYASATHTHDDRYLRLSDTGSFFDRIIDSAPGTLDTLNELAAAIGDDANFSASIARVIAEKADANHTHNYDNYQYWTVADRTTSSRLESTNTLTVLGADGATVTLDTTTNTLTISSTDTDTTYAQATSSTLGLVKIGYTANAKNYPVALDGTGKMYVNVPWTDTDTNTVTSVGVSGDLSTGNIELRGAGATSITKSGGTITISSSDTDTTYSAGTGLTLTGTTFSVTANTYAAANHNHDGRYSFAHVDSGGVFADLRTAKNSDYVTFDQSNGTGLPSTAWYNGFVTTHSDYLSSYLVNEHRTGNWYFGWRDNDNTISDTWVKIWHAGNLTNVSQLTNDAGYITSYTDTNTVTSVGIADDLSTGDITLRGAGATTITKSGGVITISSTDTDTNTTYSAGTGLTLSGTTFSVTTGTYTSYDDIRSLGSYYINDQGSNATCTTAQFITEIENGGAFDSFTSVFKTPWDYAGNNNISDAGTFGPTELAGMSFITWTDNSSDTTRGNITVLGIAPNTGGSAGGMFVYNDQGSGYSPGWREIWTSATDGAGSGLDADTVDGIQGDSFLRSDADDSFSGNLTTAQSKWIKFYHPTQTDSNDGKIGAGVFDTGLNIVGVQTAAGTGRQVRIWGSVITDGGDAFYHAGNLRNVSQLTNDAGYITSYTDTNTVTSVGVSGDLSTGDIVIRGGGATTVTKSGGTITITSTDTDTNTTYSAGTGLTLSGTTFSVTAGTYAAANHNHDGTYQKQIDEVVVDITRPDASSGTWTTADGDDWGTPRIGTVAARYNDGTGYIQFNIPEGMDTAYMSQLTWSSGGYADIYGIQADGGAVFLRRVNTRQSVENSNEGSGGGNPNQHDGTTITLLGTGLSTFSAIRIQNRSGRIHLTGMSFSSNRLVGAEGTGMVHPAQLSTTSGLNADTLDGLHASSFLQSLPGHTHSIGEVEGLADELDGKQPAGSYLTSESDTLATVTGRGNSTSTALYLTGGSSTVPALHIRSGGSSWSEGLAVHPSSDSGYALAFFRTKAAYTDQTNTWAIGNLGDANARDHFGLLRKGLTGSSADRASDAIFTINPNGTFKFGFDPYVGANKIIHAGNIGSQSVSYATSAGSATSATSATTAGTVTGQSSISRAAHAAGANDYNLELYSSDTGDSAKYVSLRFHQGSRYWGQIRYNAAGFRLTGGADNNLVPIYASIFHGALSGNATTATTADSANAVEWDNVRNKPDAFSPSSHTHAISDVTGLQTALDGKAAATHTHSYLPLSGGTLTGTLTIAAGQSINFTGWGESHSIFVETQGGASNGKTRTIFQAADDFTADQGWEFRSYRYDGATATRFYIPGNGGKATMNGANVATETWVASQGYLTSYTDTNTVTSVGVSGDLSTGDIVIRGGGATTVTKSGGTITITSTDTDTNTTYSAGTGLTLSGTTFSVTAGTYAAASHTHDDRYYTESESISLFARRDTSTNINGNLVLGNTAYNQSTAYGNWGARLFFNGSDADAQGNYYIGTNGEDVGGNYSKLDLRWHTGIRMGAQPVYGGMRFYDSEDLGTVLFSVGFRDTHVRVTNDLYVGGAVTANKISTGFNASQAAPRWDSSFYVLQSQHWYAQSSTQDMYLGESSNAIFMRGLLRIGDTTSNGYLQEEGTYGMALIGVSSIGMRTVNDTWTNAANHGIRSTDLNGNWGDDISINSYHDITLRLDSNNNNADGYVRFMNNSTGNGQFAYIGYNGSAYEAYFSGTLYATGNIIGYYSDERLKTKTGKIENALDKVKALTPFYYVPNETAKELGFTDNSVHIGLSAQEVQSVLPEVVKSAPFDLTQSDETGEKASKSGEEYLTVQYERMVPLLIQAIKDQQALIEQQQKQIDELKALVNGLTK